jgi:hypothetical protein
MEQVATMDEVDKFCEEIETRDVDCKNLMEFCDTFEQLQHLLIRIETLLLDPDDPFLQNMYYMIRKKFFSLIASTDPQTNISTPLLISIAAIIQQFDGEKTHEESDNTTTPIKS